MPKLIMTAEVSASVRQMVSFTLKENGYEVVEAADGQDALHYTQWYVQSPTTKGSRP